MPPIRTLPLILAVTLLGLAGCQTLSPAAPAPAVVPAAAATDGGPAANDELDAVAWFQTAVEYRLIAGETYRAALVQLDKAIKSPDWDALAKEDRDTPARGLPAAIIVDVDETVLDNSPFQARLVRDNKGFDEYRWRQWTLEEAAQPIPGALEFIRAAAARGVVIYYISNRAADLTDATIANLRKAGFPIKDAGQFLGLGTIIDGCEDEGSEKGCRRRLVGHTHRVLMQFGDQLGDLVTTVANTPAGREQAIAPYLGWVGERWFVLPNPMYGSWQSALINNDWTQPESERRRQMQSALRFSATTEAKP